MLRDAREQMLAQCGGCILPETGRCSCRICVIAKPLAESKEKCRKAFLLTLDCVSVITNLARGFFCSLKFFL